MVGVDTLVEQSSGQLVTAGQLASFASTHATLPVLDPLMPLFPHGALQRGRVYSCVGVGATSLAVSMSSRATHAGSWLAFVDVPGIGYAAARDFGVAVQRVVSVDAGDVGARWARVLGAIIDGFDIVITSTFRCSAPEARRLHQRVQAQSTVLITLGVPMHVTPDVVMRIETASWQFNSHARSREMNVSSGGRRAHRAGAHSVLLPDARGGLSGVADAVDSRTHS